MVRNRVPGVVDADEEENQGGHRHGEQRLVRMRTRHEGRSAALKWTTFGLPNADSDSSLPRSTPASVTSVSTTNWSPVSAPADEPTIT